jgi:hypothetical protein
MRFEFARICAQLWGVPLAHALTMRYRSQRRALPRKFICTLLVLVALSASMIAPTQALDGLVSRSLHVLLSLTRVTAVRPVADSTRSSEPSAALVTEKSDTATAAVTYHDTIADSSGEYLDGLLLVGPASTELPQEVGFAAQSSLAAIPPLKGSPLSSNRASQVSTGGHPIGQRSPPSSIAAGATLVPSDGRAAVDEVVDRSVDHDAAAWALALLLNSAADSTLGQPSDLLPANLAGLGWNVTEDVGSLGLFPLEPMLNSTVGSESELTQTLLEWATSSDLASASVAEPLMNSAASSRVVPLSKRRVSGEVSGDGAPQVSPLRPPTLMTAQNPPDGNLPHWPDPNLPLLLAHTGILEEPHLDSAFSPYFAPVVVSNVTARPKNTRTNAAVPEPNALALLITGGVGLIWRTCKRRTTQRG